MTREDVTASCGQACHADPGPSRAAYLFTSGGSTAEPKLAWIPAGAAPGRDRRPHWQPLHSATDTVANLAMPGRLWSAHLFYNRLAERAGAGVIGLGTSTTAEMGQLAGLPGTPAAPPCWSGTPGAAGAVLRHCAELSHPLRADCGPRSGSASSCDAGRCSSCCRATDPAAGAVRQLRLHRDLGDRPQRPRLRPRHLPRPAPSARRDHRRRRAGRRRSARRPSAR